MTKIVIPSSPEELEDLLADKPKVEQLMAEGQFSELVEAYVRAVHDRDQSIQQQIREETQKVLAQWLKDNPVDTRTGRLDLSPYPTPPAAGPQQRIGRRANPNAVGAPLNGVFASKTELIAAVWNVAHKHGSPTPEQTEKIGKIRAYQEKVPSEGGFLVPEEFRAEIMQLALESAIVRPRAVVIPMSGPTLRFPTVDDTSHASSVLGGIVVYRTEEGAEFTESAAAFGSVKLETTKQTALAHVPNELIRDTGGAFEAFLEESFPPAIAWFEDADFINGTGVGAPLGGCNQANEALIVVAAEATQTTGTIVWENVIRMYARMLPASLGRAVWLASPDTFFQLATMALSVGTGGSAVWLPDGRGEPVLTLLGRPVIMTEKAPGTVGTQGDLSFVDWGMYLIGDRQAMTIDASPHVKFTSDRTTFRVVARNDGRPWLQSPITPKNGGATLSPFIQLASR